MKMTKVIKRIQDHFVIDKNRYCNAGGSCEYPPLRLAGYTWQRGHERLYLMLPPVFEEMTRGVNREALLRELNKGGCLAHTASGEFMETKSVNGANVRGIVFIPAAWEGGSQTPVQTAMPTPQLVPAHVALAIESLDLDDPSSGIFN